MSCYFLLFFVLGVVALYRLRTAWCSALVLTTVLAANIKLF